MEIVKLNVGGRLFITTKETLVKSPYFAVRLSGKMDPGPLCDGNIFVDRNPDAFAHVLQVLRSGGEPPYESIKDIPDEYVRAEMEYFCLVEKESASKRKAEGAALTFEDTLGYDSIITALPQQCDMEYVKDGWDSVKIFVYSKVDNCFATTWLLPYNGISLFLSAQAIQDIRNFFERTCKTCVMFPIPQKHKDQLVFRNGMFKAYLEKLDLAAARANTISSTLLVPKIELLAEFKLKLFPQV